MDEQCAKAFAEFTEVVRRLRKECPWDSTQTHESLKPCLVDETREVLEAIDSLNAGGNGDNLCEELGDVLLSVVLHSVIAEEEGLFTMEDVISGVSEKMKFRHPRIFSPQDEEICSLSWEELKKMEKARRKRKAIPS